MNDTLPRLVVTPGEPAGVGPDICLKLVQQDIDAELVFVTDPEIIQARARQLGISTEQQVVEPSSQLSKHRAGSMNILPVQCKTAVTAGELNSANATYVTQTLDIATDLVHQGSFDALITAPVHKGIINDAGIAFTGHTEWLAQRTGAARPVMMLANGDLRVALATTHLSLQEVPAAITAPLLKEVTQILHDDLQNKFHIKQPRIRICGLNPHAGEDGHLGREEIEIMSPIIESLRAQGMNLQGPVPADTAFLPDSLKHTDAILAMYHDQGLPVLKYSGFETAINITLGLPIIRTSVDHGTALELAGTGQANVSSLRAAVDTAIMMARSYD